MKRIQFTAATAIVALVLAGCGNSTSGGPGVAGKPKEEKKTGIVTQEKNTFSVDVPAMATKLKRGETQQVSIGINRGTDMNQAVTLKFSDLPAGVSFEPASAVIPSTEKETKLMLKTTGDAPIGDFTVKVIGHPENGPDATNDMKVSISAAS